MKTFLYSLLFMMLMLSASSFGQTFWGVTHNDNKFNEGTIFSYDADAGVYTDEYVFKPNIVYKAWNAFEEGAYIYVGVCERSFEESANAPGGKSYIYRYNAISDSTEIVKELPHPFHVQIINHSTPGNVIYFNNDEVIGFVLNNPLDSVILIRYSIQNDLYQEITRYSTNPYPGEGEFSYSVSNCYFSIIDNSKIIFSLSKKKGLADNGSSNEGRNFYVFNPQDNSIKVLFNVPYTDSFIPYGPILTTTTGKNYCPGRDDFLELNIADKSYTIHAPFQSKEYNENGMLFQSTDTSFIGLMDYYDYNYLYEYSFVNDTIVAKYTNLGIEDNNLNAFVKKGDSIYFSASSSSGQYKLIAYKPGSAPKVTYTLTNPAQGNIKYLVDAADSNVLLSFYSGLSEYYIDKKAYVSLVRFSGDDNFWGYKDGASPQSDLLLASNNKLYGIASNGGRGTYYYGDGVLFEIDPESKKYQPLTHFTGENGGFGSKDSYGTIYSKQQGSLIEYNGKIYGTTYTNGTPAHAPGYGTIFTYDINAMGNNFKKIFDFNDSTDASAGRLVTSGLTLGKDNKLYGVTTNGGIGGEASGHGVMFSIDPDNNDKFDVVMKFADSETMYPVDNLTMADDGKMYGLVKKSPDVVIYWSNWGIREYDVINKTYQDIYVTSDDNHEKAYSGFLHMNGKLYGMAANSVNESAGYIYEYDIAGGQLIKKVIFASNRSEGSNPQGNLMLSTNGSLWGMTTNGGDDSGYEGDGVIFEYNLSTSDYIKHYSLNPNGDAGKDPLYSTLTEVLGSSTSIPENSTEQGVHTYPNPTDGIVKFEFDSDDILQVTYTVYNLAGNQLMSGTASVSGNVIIDLTGLDSGVYIVKLAAEGEVYTQKIVKN